MMPHRDTPERIASGVRVVAYPQGSDTYAVEVRYGAAFDEYYVDRGVELRRAKSTARSLRRSLVLAAWDLTKDKLDAVLDAAGKDDPS